MSWTAGLLPGRIQCGPRPRLRSGATGPDTSGLVCRYRQIGGHPGGPGPQFGVLYASPPLDGRQAVELTRIIDAIKTEGPPSGPISCPAQLNGMATVIAFDYPHRSVDLWYQDSGCQEIDNGVIGASEIGNASFEALPDWLNAIAPAPYP